MATIKAGTYRFNDVLSAPSGLTLDYPIYAECGVVCNGTSYSAIGITAKQLINNAVSKFIVWLADFENDAMLTLYSNVAYQDSNTQENYTAGWQSADYQTITIPYDQDASDEFGEWFTANAVEQKEISGVWKFYDVLTQSHASNDFGGYIFEGHFTATSCLNVPAMPEYGIEAYTGKHTFECTQIYQEYNDSVEGYIGSVSYRVITVQPDFPERLGITLPIEPYVYSSAGKRWDTVYGRGFQTLDFGTEPQYVSVDFYNWLTENATQPTATIHYNGSTIASLFGGQTATVKLKGDGVQVVPDIVFEVAEVSGGGSGATVVPLTVTENGVYDTYYEVGTETWDSNTEYAGSITVDGVTLSFKKAEKLIVPDDLNELKSSKYSYGYEWLVDGETATWQSELFPHLAITSGVFATLVDYAVLWVKKAAPLNAQFGVNFIEDNTVYITNYLPLMAQVQVGATYCKVSVTAPSKKVENVAFCPVTVELPIEHEQQVITPTWGTQFLNKKMSGKYYEYIRVDPVPTQTLEVYAGTKDMTYTPDEGKFFDVVTVKGADLSDLSSMKVLCGIGFKTFPKTEYKIGEYLNVSGAVLQCWYTDGTTQEVNADSYSMYHGTFDNQTPGKYIMTVKYTEGGITAVTTYQINVTE